MLLLEPKSLLLREDEARELGRNPIKDMSGLSSQTRLGEASTVDSVPWRCKSDGPLCGFLAGSVPKQSQVLKIGFDWRLALVMAGLVVGNKGRTAVTARQRSMQTSRHGRDWAQVNG